VPAGAVSPSSAGRARNFDEVAAGPARPNKNNKKSPDPHQETGLWEEVRPTEKKWIHLDTWGAGI
jgi:hypothetical protein